MDSVQKIDQENKIYDIKYSYIILAYNEQNYIYRTLEKIKKYNDSNSEIICVDDGSSDYTSQIIEKFDDINKILNKKNLGYGEAFKQAINLAKGKYLIFLPVEPWYINDYTINNMKKLLEEYHFVMGARLDKLENVMHRSIFYRFIGKLKSLQLKLFNDIKIMDPFSDFFGIQNDIVNKINFTSSNYNIKIELLKYVNNKEYKIIEFPIFSKIDEVFI